jgi:hypothetical protein
MKHESAVGRAVVGSRRRVVAWRAAIASLLACAALASEAHITRLELVRVESPTFGGATFGSVGAYEKITARAFGEVDPALPGNALITDIQNAPRNVRGNVEYSTDVFILKPIDPSLGSGKIFYDVVNRGGKGSFSAFNQAPSPSGVANTPASGAGTGLLMRRGYTIVWSGWEDPFIIGTGANTLTAALPVARNPDGSSIVEDMIIEQIFDNSAATDFTLPFHAATLDKARAKMVVHNHTHFVGGPLVDRVPVPDDLWSYVNDRTVRINRSHPFLTGNGYDAGAAFEFVYPARDPIVLALGFAATRDLISFLKHDTSAQNPVRNAIQYALGRGDSQSGRYLKGLLYWGFNADEAGRIVFDGMSPHISGAHAIASNDRFGDSNATGRSYQRHLSAKMEFPFTYEVRTDPFLRITDGILKRCLASGTCPKIMHTDSANESFLKPGSLLTTDGPGNGAMPTDLALPDNVRIYTIGSTQHGPSNSITTTPSGVCQLPGNPNQWAPYVRNLGIQLDDWVTRGIAPATSRYGRVADGTLIRTEVTCTFPIIPGVNYTGWYNNVDVLDKSVLPSLPIPGMSYTVLVPSTDAAGNDLPGVRTLDVQVPLGTYTGWALRRAPFAANEDCALTGQYIPFRATEAARAAAGDPRPSVAGRYPTFEAYDSQVIAAINATIQDRLLLCEDGNAELARLRNAGATRGVPNPPASFTPYSVPLANTSVKASQPTMWPPNNKMVSQSFAVEVPETCSVSCAITGISGDDGATPSDWQVTGPLAAQLRAARSGNGATRTYTVALQCTDPSTSLSAAKSVAVTVPHDQGK